jgi:hypothetical protein
MGAKAVRFYLDEISKTQSDILNRIIKEIYHRMSKKNDEMIRICMRSCGYKGNFSKQSVRCWRGKHRSYIVRDVHTADDRHTVF